MALILSTYGNTAFRSEDISSISKLRYSDSNKQSRNLGIAFKNGHEMTLQCKSIKEANELFDTITKVMVEDYKWNGFHKP